MGDKHNSGKESDGYSTDDQARKRKTEGEEMEGASERSKRLIRTPKKTHSGNEDKLDLILNAMKQMKTDLTNEIHQIREDHRVFAEEVGKLKLENAKLKNENKEIREELEEVKLTVERLDKERRKNNVVINGLKIDVEDKTTLKSYIEKFMEQKLGVLLQLRETHRLGEKTCLITMKNENDKEQVMRNKHKLRHYKEAAVFIDNDMTKQEREIQGHMRRFEREERNRGKHVRRGYNKVNIEGEDWKWDRRRQEMIKTSPKN